ncbi:MAG TPA: glycosyltransferase family 9 protein [Candidatus Omnitrophota bacterium]|nr:glycosyltransferase family 9 protein [Candidatus Omnitrophota bacterium]
MMEKFENILIVRTDRIGDVVLTMPSVKALREAYPQARISILVAPATRDLVDGNICLDEVLVDDRRREHKGLTGFLRLVAMIRRKRFDCALVLHTKKRTNLTCFLAGVPVRIGYKNNKFGFLLTRPIADTRQKGEKHEAQYCLDVLKEIGVISHDLDIDLPVKEDAVRWAERVLIEHHVAESDRLVAIHPGASDPAKQWPESRFLDLSNRLVEKYRAKIIMIGAADIKEISGTIVSGVKGDVIDLTGRTTVGQLAAVLMRCGLLVSNDSGPVHVAAGVGTPVVSIFTRNQPGINPERWRPLGENARVVSVCPSQSSGISFKKAQKPDTEYLELITTEAVLEAVDSLYKLC